MGGPFNVLDPVKRQQLQEELNKRSFAQKEALRIETEVATRDANPLPQDLTDVALRKASYASTLSAARRNRAGSFVTGAPKGVSFGGPLMPTGTGPKPQTSLREAGAAYLQGLIKGFKPWP